MMERDILLASGNDIENTRKNYKVGMYFSLAIILIIAIWTFASEARWLVFDSGVGTRANFDIWIVVGVIVTSMGTAVTFTVLGQMAKGLTRECDVLGGIIHLEERQLMMIWAIVIGSVLGMGFWDIVTIVHLAIDYGILNIWLIDVTVFDFGIWQMVIPVWGLTIIGVTKMTIVVVLYILAMKNMRRGTICELANFDSKAILD